jgi:hypothetical protein
VRLRCSISTPPATTAYDLAAAKAHARISHSAEDSVVTLIANAAQDVLGDYLGLSWISAGYTWNPETMISARSPLSDFWYTSYPDGVRNYPAVSLPYGPVTAITSIRYKDQAGAFQTWSAAEYQLDTRLGRVMPVPGATWPSSAFGYVNPYEIVFTAGYADRNAIPARLTLALHQLIGFWCDNREPFGSFTLQEVPLGIFNLIDEYKRG